MDIRIRRARPAEAPQLTDLAMKAKASWGYDEVFMAQCRAELAITPEKMEAWTIWVAESAGDVVGMIALVGFPPEAEVEEFMVDPEFHGRGAGTALMTVLLDECRRREIQRIGLDADPNAETIYRKLGFQTIGRSPSQSIPGRTLPRMVRTI